MTDFSDALTIGNRTDLALSQFATDALTPLNIELSKLSFTFAQEFDRLKTSSYYSIDN